jgi:hypothetical protein
VDGADHFAIFDALAQPEGVLTRALLAMLGRQPPAFDPGFGDNGDGAAARNRRGIYGARKPI